MVPGQVVSTFADLEEPFDLVTLWDVLEHIVSPVPFLSDVHPLVRPGGRLMVSSPNFAAMKLRWEIARLDPGRFLHDRAAS